MSELAPGTCSRCIQPIKDFMPPDGGMTSGYYDVTRGYWRKFANEGEVYLCDACMWSDPLYVMHYGARQ